MTSMPASRSARAMILAPRSWPSRPGLATTTPILPRPSTLAGWIDAAGTASWAASLLCSCVPFVIGGGRLPLDLHRHLHRGRVDRADDRRVARDPLAVGTVGLHRVLAVRELVAL